MEVEVEVEMIGAMEGENLRHVGQDKMVKVLHLHPQIQGKSAERGEGGIAIERVDGGRGGREGERQRQGDLQRNRQRGAGGDGLRAHVCGLTCVP